MHLGVFCACMRIKHAGLVEQAVGEVEQSIKIIDQPHTTGDTGIFDGQKPPKIRHLPPKINYFRRF
jgi:hypothetical protein